MGMVADFVNYLVKRRLPEGAQQTEAVEEDVRCKRAYLQAETNALLDELINKPAIFGSDKHGSVHD